LTNWLTVSVLRRILLQEVSWFGSSNYSQILRQKSIRNIATLLNSILTYVCFASDKNHTYMKCCYLACPLQQRLLLPMWVALYVLLWTWLLICPVLPWIMDSLHMWMFRRRKVKEKGKVTVLN